MGITQNRLKRLLEYNPKTGIFTRAGHRLSVGSLDRGYWRLWVDKKLYYTHRLAWLHMTGKFPFGEIDHVDGNRSNNSWSNLRRATRSQNAANTKKNTNTSGRKGVSWDKQTQKWRAKIQHHYRSVCLGRYDALDKAATAYAEAAKKIFGEYAKL